MSPEVLILSSIYDFSTDHVVLELEKCSVSCLRLNREQFPDHRLTLDPIAQTLTVEGPTGHHFVDSSLQSVWFRQPIFLRNTPATPLSPREQLERSQWSAFLRALSVFSEAAWMNHPAATYLAECKPFQLATAVGCGFHVPDTFVSNDAVRIQKRFPAGLVLKSLDTVLLRDGDDCLFTYTTIDSSAALNDQNVQMAPLIAQHIVKDKTDLRVTVVGDDVFTVRILSNGTGVPGDWRVVPRSQLEYRDVVLPTQLADNCRHLTQTLGLSFAAIDLIETPNEFFFIEVNPTGEWGWLSTEKRRIDVSIATWLRSPT